MPTRGRRRRLEVGTADSDLTAKQLSEMAFDLARLETRPGVVADMQEACFHQMEEELANRQRVLNRLRELLKHASHSGEPEIKDAVSLAKEAVDAQEKKLAEYLNARPWLLEKLYNSEPMTDENEELSGHLPEKDWRRHLVSLMTNKEKEWREQLQKEQEMRIQAWQATEHTRQQSQCEQIQRAMLERHERMEAEWRQKLEGVQQTQLRGWMEEERKRTEEILSEQMARIAQDARERERGWLRQLKADLEKVEKELQEQHKLELRLLEIEWREQEVLQRERVYLRKREQEMLDEQQQRLEHLSQQLRQALAPSQEKRLAEWLDLQAEEWDKRRDAWHLELNRQNEQAVRRLTEEHRVTVETTSNKLVDELGSALQSERERIQKTYDDWLKSQHEALNAIAETWDQRHLVRLGELGDEWNRRLLDEQTERRSTYDVFSRQLNEDRIQAISEAQAEVRNSTLTTLERFAEEYKDAEAKREELWKQHTNGNIEGMKSDWMGLRQTALEQYQLLRDEQDSRLSALDQLLHELAERFAVSEAERQRSWVARSSSALEELSREMRQYFEERTTTSIANLDDKGDQLLRSLEQDAASLKQSLCDDVEHKQEALADRVDRSLNHALGDYETRVGLFLSQQEQLMGKWKTGVDEESRRLLTELQQTWNEQSKMHLHRLQQRWDEERAAEEGERRAYWSTLQHELQQKLNAETDAQLDDLRAALQRCKEQLDRELQDVAEAADRQIAQSVSGLQEHLNSDLASMHQTFSASEENRERIWQLNSAATLDAMNRKVSEQFVEYRRANDENLAKWLTERTAEFLRVMADFADKQEQQTEAILQTMRQRTAECLHEIGPDAQLQWAGMFAEWADRQTEAAELLGKQQYQTLVVAAGRWMDEQKEELQAMIGAWNADSALTLKTHSEAWKASSDNMEKSFKTTRQALIQELHQRVEREMKLWLNQQVTRVDQILHGLVETHKEELQKRERYWQEIRDEELAMLHKQGSEIIVELCREWDDAQKVARQDFEQRCLNEQHTLIAGELSEMISAKQNDALSELTNFLQQQVDENLHRLEKEVDMVLQEQLEQTLRGIATDINQSLEEMRREMTERYLQELAKSELDLQECFTQQMESVTAALKEQFKDLWQQQAEEYTRLHESELAEQQGRSLSRFEQSLTHECQRLRERYEQLISELREGTRSKQEAELKALQDAAYREYRTRLDQIVGELSSNHRNELSSVVQERDAKLVAEIRQDLKAEIQKQLDEERKERLTKAAQPTEPTRRNKRTRR